MARHTLKHGDGAGIIGEEDGKIYGAVFNIRELYAHRFVVTVPLDLLDTRVWAVFVEFLQLLHNRFCCLLAALEHSLWLVLVLRLGLGLLRLLWLALGLRGVQIGVDQRHFIVLALLRLFVAGGQR